MVSGGVCGPLMLKHCGKDVNIYKCSKIAESVELGDRSDIGLRAQIFGKVIIGNDVIMGPEVVMYTKNHESSRTDIPIKYQGSTEERIITIENGVWIGHGALILPGVTIGEGAIVAARCVVTKNVAPFSVVAGNPGKIVKQRKRSRE